MAQQENSDTHEALEMDLSVLLLGSVESDIPVSNITEADVKLHNVKLTVSY